MIITSNSVVKLAWTLEIDGTTIEQSLKDEPQTILMGHAKNLPLGLEQFLLEHESGAEFTAQLENAYGMYDPSKVHKAQLSDFPSGTKFILGASFYTQDANGQPLTARVIQLEQDAVVVDFNHQFAGKTLLYSVKILHVRAAQNSELEHGHVHGEGGVVHHDSF